MNIQNIPNPPIQSMDQVNTFIIVDCAHFDHLFYRSLRKEQNLVFKSLFADTLNEQAAFASPVMIEINPKTNKLFFEKIQKIESEVPAIVWLWSKDSFNNVFNTLQFLLSGELENGDKVFCRYYDPRCIEGFISFFSQDIKYTNRMKAINGWGFINAARQYTYLGFEAT